MDSATRTLRRIYRLAHREFGLDRFALVAGDVGGATKNLCLPSSSFFVLYVFGDSQGLYFPLSSLHSKVELRSSAENLSVNFLPLTFGFLIVV